MSIVNLIDNPKRVRENDWLLDNIGRISVALNTEEEDIVDVIAYSDEKTDEKALRVIAKEKNAHMIKNISEKGANYIDNIVNTMEWMLTHPGIAVAKVGKSNNYIEILRYTENPEEFKELADFAKANGYTIVHGIKRNGYRLGYLPSTT